MLGNIQPWPTFVGQRKIRELAEAAVGISELIKSIPERIFENDPQRLAEYFNIDDPDVVAKLISPPQGLAGPVSRGDFIYSASGFKCLECNMAGNIGGWDTAIIADALLRAPVIQRFLSRLDSQVSTTDTVRVLLRSIIEEVRTVEPDADEINLAIGFLGDIEAWIDPKVRGFFGRMYGAALREVDAALNGWLVFSDYSDLTLHQSELHADGKRLHAVIECHAKPTREISFQAYKAGKVRLYNGPMTGILCDKRNLALLSELSESEHFDAQEKATIRDHLPWTRRVAAGESTYEGRTVLLRDLLIAERGRMVLKRGLSRAGQDVAIGRLTSEEQWVEAVDQAMGDGTWVVQERVESLPYLYQKDDYGCAPHDVIWGPFVFGKNYGGTIARMIPRDEEGAGDMDRGFTKGILVELDT
ncbi:MAG: hypothetical protein GY856_04650 [bacterium]|nr:hypothetical protein [bacterium]